MAVGSEEDVARQDDPERGGLPAAGSALEGLRGARPRCSTASCNSAPGWPKGAGTVRH